MMIDNREYKALNIYCALCYYKQEYFEISLDMMQSYISSYPNSIVATNLKACNYFQLMQGKNAEEEFKRLEKNYKGGDLYADYDLLRHNLCVFRCGENALQVLPPLLDLFPEAKLNLVIYYLKNDEVEEAHKLTADLEPVSPREYMLKGIVMAIMGQKANNREQITQAQQLFQMIGTSATECDTIPGRQCAASYLFLKKQFDSVSIYLKTIKEYLGKDDDFNWNYGIACANVKQWKEAEEALTAIESEKYKTDFIYICWLARVYVMNGEPNSAWQLYLDMDTSNDSLILMNQIANDCYRKGFFVISLKAFYMLCRLDSENEQQLFQGKLGAAVGVFQMVITRKATAEQFEDMLSILKNTTGIDKDPAVDQILSTIRKWCLENNYNCSL